MLAIDDQTRRVARLLLDAKCRAAGSTVRVEENADAAGGERTLPVASIPRGWERGADSAPSCGLAPHFRPQPIFLNGLP